MPKTLFPKKPLIPVSDALPGEPVLLTLFKTKTGKMVLADDLEAAQAPLKLGTWMTPGEYMVFRLLPDRLRLFAVWEMQTRGVRFSHVRLPYSRQPGREVFPS